MPASDGDIASYYGVYQTTGPVIDVNDPEQLVSIGGSNTFSGPMGDSSVTYRFAIVAYDDGDNESAPTGDIVTGLEITQSPSLPQSHLLLQNYPNPFNAQTTITFELVDGPLPARLEIYNIMGQRIKSLLDQPLPGGRYQLTWDGTDEAGRETASGIYLFSLCVGDWRQTKKMVLVR